MRELGHSPFVPRVVLSRPKLRESVLLRLGLRDLLSPCGRVLLVLGSGAVPPQVRVGRGNALIELREARFVLWVVAFGIKLRESVFLPLALGYLLFPRGYVLLVLRIGFAELDALVGSGNDLIELREARRMGTASDRLMVL